MTIKNHAGHTALEYAMMEGRLRQCQDHKECIERKIEQKKEREEVIRLIKNQLAK